MKYCSKCGAQLDDSAKFCGVCGNRMDGEFDTSATGTAGRYSNPAGSYNNPAGNSGQTVSGPAKEAVQTVVKKMRTSATLWTVIGICQLISGLCTICFGYGVAPIILGIYNLVQSSRERKNAAKFEKEPVGIVSYFESRGMLVVVFLFLNFFAGAFFGVIGSIYDMTVRSKALSLRTQLLDAENMYRNTGSF